MNQTIGSKWSGPRQPLLSQSNFGYLAAIVARGIFYTRNIDSNQNQVQRFGPNRVGVIAPKSSFFLHEEDLEEKCDSWKQVDSKKGRKGVRPGWEELIFDLSTFKEKWGGPLSSSSTFLYLPVFFKGHSKPSGETFKALSVRLSCNSVTRWAVWWDERSLFMSDPEPWSRLLHSQVLPLLTASPPPTHLLRLKDGGSFTLTKTQVWE